MGLNQSNKPTPFSYGGPGGGGADELSMFQNQAKLWATLSSDYFSAVNYSSFLPRKMFVCLGKYRFLVSIFKMPLDRKRNGGPAIKANPGCDVHQSLMMKASATFVSPAWLFSNHHRWVFA